MTDKPDAWALRAASRIYGWMHDTEALAPTRAELVGAILDAHEAAGWEALREAAQRIWDFCDQEGDGAPDDHPHTRKLLEFRDWLGAALTRVEENR